MTTTVEHESDAAKLADILLGAAGVRLAACVQVVGPITSRYRWQGSLTTSTEWSVIVKTTMARADAVVAALVDAHPYDVPEVLVTPVLGGHEPYLAWVREQTSSSGSDA